jgi:hypothetical protein
MINFLINTFPSNTDMRVLWPLLFKHASMQQLAEKTLQEDFARACHR